MSIDRLIERLEAASEGSRELDARIHHALNPDQRVMLDPGKAFGKGAKYPATYGPLAEFPIDGWPDGEWESVCRHIDAKPVTTSIDAALSLVPEDHWFDLYARQGDGGDDHRACCAKNGGRSYAYRGATPALALCIAALRAHAASLTPKGEQCK